MHQHCDCSLPVPQHHVEQRRNPPDISHFNLTLSPIPQSENNIQGHVFALPGPSKLLLTVTILFKRTPQSHRSLDPCVSVSDMRESVGIRILFEYLRPNTSIRIRVTF